MRATPRQSRSAAAPGNYKRKRSPTAQPPASVPWDRAHGAAAVRENARPCRAPRSAAAVNWTISCRTLAPCGWRRSQVAGVRNPAQSSRSRRSDGRVRSPAPEWARQSRRERPRQRYYPSPRMGGGLGHGAHQSPQRPANQSEGAQQRAPSRWSQASLASLSQRRPRLGVPLQARRPRARHGARQLAPPLARVVAFAGSWCANRQRRSCSRCILRTHYASLPVEETPCGSSKKWAWAGLVSSNCVDDPERSR